MYVCVDRALECVSRVRYARNAKDLNKRLFCLPLSLVRGCGGGTLHWLAGLSQRLACVCVAAVAVLS